MNTKLPIFPIVVISVLGILGIIWLWLKLNITIQPRSPAPPLLSNLAAEPQIPATISPNSTNSTAGAKHALVAQQAAPGSSPTEASLHQGALRVSNQTNQPLRLVLLARRSESGGYNQPAHWDFAPEEGSARGLLVSLPDMNLRVKTGDILAAFAVDGSRHYWGPYVVGETNLPIWDSQAGEWQLILH